MQSIYDVSLKDFNVFYSYHGFGIEEKDDYKYLDYLFMIKANSNVEYHYKLLDRKENPKELVKVSYDLGKKDGKKREITLDLETKEISTIRVTEDQKEYIIHLPRYIADKLLNNFEEIGKTLSIYNFLNLERILKTINCKETVYKCMILKENELQAKLCLAGGLIKEYEINDPVRNLVIREHRKLPKIKFTKEESVVDTIDKTKEPHKYQLNKLLRWL